MITVILVIHLLIASTMVGVILIQRSEGGALSGLGGGTMGGLMTTRGTANLLTRATAILAGHEPDPGDPGRAQPAWRLDSRYGTAPGHHGAAPRSDPGRAGRACGTDCTITADRFMATRPAPLAASAREAAAADMGET